MRTPFLPPAWRVLLWACDLVCAAAATLIATACLTGSFPAGPALLAAPLAATLVAFLVHAAGAPLPGRGAPWRSVTIGAIAVGGLSALATAACAATGGAPWLAVALAAALAGPVAAICRLLVWMTLRDGMHRRVVLVGPLDCRLRLREHLQQHADLGYRIVAEVGPGVSIGVDTPVHPLDDLELAVRDSDPDEVLLSTGFDDRQLLHATMSRLLDRPLIVRFVPDIEAVPLFCPRPSDIAGLPAIDLSRGPLTPAAECAKWLEDKFVAVVALAVLGVPMLLIAAIIRLTSSGPALFVQERHGRDGRSIRVYKFRTMKVEHCTADVTTGKFKQAQKGDMRVTAFGRFLRNTSLDELPQFINVLFGDMSVVGPRPHPIALNKRFSSDIGDLMRRHYVKPGITGLAQISGARGETRTVDDMRRRVNYDLEYLRTWSLWLDVTIIARTLVAGWINRQP